MKLQCVICEKEFERNKFQKTCSIKCRNKYIAQNRKINLQKVGDQLRKLTDDRKKSVRAEYDKHPSICLNCHNPIERKLEERPSMAKGKLFCSRSCSARYQAMKRTRKSATSCKKARNKESNQLGMSVGTAHQRLRKMIMFSLVQKCGMDVCHRCGLKIKTLKELSIEHKQSWLDIDPQLFWDIENIAFSHLYCNVAWARKKGKKN